MARPVRHHPTGPTAHRTTTGKDRRARPGRFCGASCPYPRQTGYGGRAFRRKSAGRQCFRAARSAEIRCSYPPLLQVYAGCPELLFGLGDVDGHTLAGHALRRAGEPVARAFEDFGASNVVGPVVVLEPGDLSVAQHVVLDFQARWVVFRLLHIRISQVQQTDRVSRHIPSGLLASIGAKPSPYLRAAGAAAASCRRCLAPTTSSRAGSSGSPVQSLNRS